MLYRFYHRTGWWILGYLCALPVLRWASMEPLGDRFAGPVDGLLSLGQVAGILGLTLFSFNLLLAARLKVFEDLFGGLNKVMIAHHLIGGTALVMLMMHPVFLALRYLPTGAREAALLFVPQWSNLPVAFGILALSALIGLLVITFFVKMPYRWWVLTHKFLGLVFFLAGLHVLLTPNDLTRDHGLQFYLLGLVALGLAAHVYRTLLPNVFVRRYNYVVNEAKTVAAGTVEVTLLPVGKPMNFKAGQFLFVSFRGEGISHEWHPFSISSPPAGGGVNITVKSLGGYTKTLTSLLPAMKGMSVRIEGAYGRFSYQNFANPNQVWVAGGIGITPFLAMAQALGAEAHQIDLYYSVKSESELVGQKELKLLESEMPGQAFRLIPFVSDKQGFLTAKYINETSGGLAGKEILLCGPPPMMKAMKQQLRQLGVKPGRIHSEEFSLQ